MREVFIALGSNLGAPDQNVLRAMVRLAQQFPEGFRSSEVYRTEPVDMAADATDFANAVVAFKSDLPLDTLLSNLQALEAEFGRPKDHGKNTARTLDLDLIAAGDETLSTPALTLPHPRALDRRFVLQPLQDIAPEFRFPGNNEGLSILIQRAPSLVVALWD
jgi:2-amino-4-hydroxy-6-hydroxymethyldihydropteridine diphosphokinase